MQQIEDEAKQQKIKDLLYPGKDAQGNSFFATLRQHAALDQMREFAERRDAAETVRIKQQDAQLSYLQRNNEYLAVGEGTPKIYDFRDNVLNPLRVRIMQGGEDGRLALKELEALQPERSLSLYKDSYGQPRDSVELRAAVEKMISDARAEARGTHIGKLRDSAIKDLTETQIAADELMSYKDYLPAEKFNEAVALRAEIQKYSLNSDYANPDPVAIANLGTRLDSFNLGQLRKLREAREGQKVVQEANPNLGVTEVSSGPEGVKVKGEAPKLAAAPGAAEIRGAREKQAVEIEDRITQNQADIEILKKRKEEGKTGSALETKNKDGTSTGKGIDDLIQENKVLEQQLLDLKRTQNMPLSGKDRQVQEAVSGQGGSSSVPNVIQRAPQSAPSATGTRVNTPTAYQPSIPVPASTNPVAVIRFVKQADGKVVVDLKSPGSTSTNNTAKPK